VESSDILRQHLKGSDQPPEEKLRAIFGEKPGMCVTPLRVPNGEKGRVVDVRVFTQQGRIATRGEYGGRGVVPEAHQVGDKWQEGIRELF